MCKCDPRMRTPFCGKLDCQWPKQVELPRCPIKERHACTGKCTPSTELEGWGEISKELTYYLPSGMKDFEREALCKAVSRLLSEERNKTLDEVLALIPTKINKKEITIDKEDTKLDCLGQGFAHCRNLAIENIEKLR